jgi:hypothetical protein
MAPGYPEGVDLRPSQWGALARCSPSDVLLPWPGWSSSSPASCSSGAVRPRTTSSRCPRSPQPLESASPTLSYGWGCIPVTARIGGTTWTTSLFPKDERYLVPVKVAVRRAEGLELGDMAEVRLELAI